MKINVNKGEANIKIKTHEDNQSKEGAGCILNKLLLIK